MTATADFTAGTARDQAHALIGRKRRVALLVPAAILAYLVYVFFAFDVAGLAERARLDNARILVADSYSHKIHVTRDGRASDLAFAVEGETKGRYPEGMRPDWVEGGIDDAVIDLGDGHVIRFLPDRRVTYDLPGQGQIDINRVNDVIVASFPGFAPGDSPDWANVSDARVTITTEAGRLTVTRSKDEVFRYFFGWELFWFTLDSPYHNVGVWTLLTGPQLDPLRSNIIGAYQDFMGNQMWRHADVFWAIGETILMAFLGTFGGALIALPLAFLAAKNFAPLVWVRFAVRRVFDFVRGVDGLIWTIILSRAFGPGPLTGALAILVTDTGSFGKSFSEALENVDEKQVEGMKSTGANAVQRYRFGVIPQVTPVLLSQVLYYFESNTRSATIIGAITGGGIGLFITQAMQTQKDWEEVSYYIVLIVMMVMAMDSFSGWLRRKLIKG
ncbi:phosphonate ABC transporter, permease protein PhnE [Frigidibacter albus]|uniref:Phosphonate ABC transporter, permease protein PhnE n=1 Tax=Frigidibacter albus TaxID=1465486 RepID=A0A6L8VDE8_9RHOB|nr:phosphonate ABC transporter, permease protein PhnE [Frigidibacter albus]MZQ88283.1 phosphonate ABC transporter, permease protein PhnE [Frigidibacter albus]NBE30043.1 phosphonate ABC transporter, permease protein PhnE [Frigidibacter albus]GGH46347.1 phosphonate ABC transporter, permease protein PhnE [Frigidibacter albus]